MAELLELDALTDADLGAWRALAADAVEPNPFFEPEFVLPAARHLARGGVRLAVHRVGTAWAAAMPVLPERWRGLPLRALGAWTHPYCFLGAPLLAPGAAAPALAALLGGLRRGTAFVPLERLPADGPVAAALVEATEGLHAVRWASWERATLRRRPGDDYLEVALNAKRRRELRRQRRLLGEQIGTVTFADAAGDDAAIEDFLAVEASGWKGRRGTAMAAAGHAGFLREVCAGFAAAGRLQVPALHAGGRLVAAQCNLLAGPGAFCFKLGVEAEFARFSPGVLLQEDNMRHFHRTPSLEWEDSCADPANEMINRLWPQRRPMTSLLIPGTGARGLAGRVQARAAASWRTRRKETS